MSATLINQLKEDFYNKVPYSIAVLDRSHTIVSANKSFEDAFGSWKNRTCFSLCRKKNQPCPDCNLEDIFITGEEKVCEETNFAQHKENLHMLVHLSPVKNSVGEVVYVLKTSIDISGSINSIKEHNILFDKVPCYITVLDRDLKIVRANEKFRETFGEGRGKYCYSVYKKKKTECASCPARDCFETGSESQSIHVGVTNRGDKAYYLVSAIPLVVTPQGVQLVIELAQDITELTIMQDQFIKINEYYGNIIDNVSDAVVAMNDKGKVQVFNDPARRLFELQNSRIPAYQTLQELLPEEVMNVLDNKVNEASGIKTPVWNSKGEKVHTAFSGFQIKHKKKNIGSAVIFHDKRESNNLKLQLMQNVQDLACGQIFSRYSSYILRTMKNCKEEESLNKLNNRIEEFDKVINQAHPMSYVDTVSVLNEIKSASGAKLFIDGSPQPMLVQKKSFIKAISSLVTIINSLNNKEEAEIAYSNYDDEVRITISTASKKDYDSVKELYELAENPDYPNLDSLNVLFAYKILKDHVADIKVYFTGKEITQIVVKLSLQKLKFLAENSIQAEA